MEFRLLGDVAACDDGGRVLALGSRQRAVLAVLLYRANAVVARSELIRLVWGARAQDWPETVEQLVADYVSHLRGPLWPGRRRGEAGGPGAGVRGRVGCAAGGLAPVPRPVPAGEGRPGGRRGRCGGAAAARGVGVVAGTGAGRPAGPVAGSGPGGDDRAAAGRRGGPRRAGSGRWCAGCGARPARGAVCCPSAAGAAGGAAGRGPARGRPPRRGRCGLPAHPRPPGRGARRGPQRRPRAGLPGGAHRSGTSRARPATGSAGGSRAASRRRVRLRRPSRAAGPAGTPYWPPPRPRRRPRW
jgi:hypothetical protein